MATSDFKEEPRRIGTEFRCEFIEGACRGRRAVNVSFREARQRYFVFKSNWLIKRLERLFRFARLGELDVFGLGNAP